jgi:hypothetical protein
MEEWNEVINNAQANNEEGVGVPTPGGLPVIGVGAAFVEDDDSSAASFGSEGEHIIDEIAGAGFI